MGTVPASGMFPEIGAAYLIVINTDNPRLLNRMWRTIERTLTARAVRTEGPPAVRVDLTTLPGTYYPSSTRFGLESWQLGKLPAAEVTAADGRLTFARRGKRVILLPLGNGQFRRTTDPVATVVFTRTPEGELMLLGELGNFVKQDDCPTYIQSCGAQGQTTAEAR